MQNNLIYKIDSFSLNKEDLLLGETIFHNANGYIGIRSSFEEGYPFGYPSIRGTYINGFYNFIAMNQAEKLCGLVEEKQTMVNVVDTQTIYLTLGDETFSMFEGELIERERLLNMEEGYTLRKVHWRSPKGKEIIMEIKRMTSFVQPSLFTIEYKVTSVNYDGTIAFTGIHNGEVENYSNPDDPRVAAEKVQHLNWEKAEYEGEVSYLLSSTTQSHLKVCTGVKGVLSKTGEQNPELAGLNERNAELTSHGAKEILTTRIEKGESITYTKYTVVTDSVRYENCEQQARKEMALALSVPLAAHYQKQTEYMTHFWDTSEVDIEGDDDLCLATKYNMYQLVQSVGKDEHGNIAAKGLSGEGYEGHFFWDTEMFMQPFFTLTNPEIARNLIAYRYETLEAAKENAKTLGHTKGALYPWRTIMGKECSGYFPSGTAQYHINGDIAYSVVAYYLATKDLAFIQEKGAEVVFETARLWLNVGNYVKGQFHINEVTGPDEYTCMVNNNYFTNAIAKYNLYWAVKFYTMLKEAGGMDDLGKKIHLTEEEIKDFGMAEKNMYLPYDEALGINPQDDSFLQKAVWDIETTPKENFPLLLHYHPLLLYRHQVCKQADTVLAHFILEDMQDIETIRKSFYYYEKITTHDSSLSTCIFSIVACKLGVIEKAYEYFGDSAKLDLFNTHCNTKDGIHTANMGGNYMAIVYGFGGLRIKENGLHLNPVLPMQWKGYQFKFMYEGSRIMVKVDAAGVKLSLLSGDKVTVMLHGEEVQVC